MKSSHKTGFVVCTILSVVFVAGFAVLWYLLNQMAPIDMFVAIITQKYFNFANIGSLINELPKFISLVASYLVTLTAVVFLVVSLFAMKGFGRKLLGFFLNLLLGIVSIGFVFGNQDEAYQWGYGAVKDGIDKISGGNIVNEVVFPFGMALCALLAIIFIIIATIKGWKYSAYKWEFIKAHKDDPKLEAEKAAEPVAASVVPMAFDAAEPEPVKDFVPEEEPEVEEEEKEEAPVEEEKPVEPVAEEQPKEEQPKEVPAQFDAKYLEMMIREIVRSEMGRAQQPNPQVGNVTGTSFGGPLIIQYFGVGPNGQVQPVPAPAPVQEPAPAPAPVQEPAPAPVEEATPAPAPAEELEVKKTEIERISFTQRVLEAEKDLKNNYNEIKNEILSYGVGSRVSFSGDTFRLHRKTFVKMVVAGKALKLYFALDPNDYADSPIPVIDVSNKTLYQEIPLAFKVKSPLSVRRCKELIKECMERDGLTQGEVAKTNWVKELKELKVEDDKEEE